ncbi:lipopolysaccharide biosynthesis protein [Vibrio fluvialis]|nr:lipopolysaccharide biosynthesis protein [Vibrio fluvialis]
MSLKKNSVMSLFWDFSSKVSMHVVTLCVSILLARVLSPSDFGLVAMATVFMGIAGVFGDAGLGAALIQRKHVTQIHYSSVFYFNVTVGLTLTVSTYLFAEVVAEFYSEPELVTLVQVLSLSFVINSLSTVHRIKMRRELKFKQLAKFGFLASLLSGFLGVIISYYGGGIWGLVSIPLVNASIFNLFIWYKCSWIPSAIFSLKALSQLWGFGYRVFLATLLDSVFTRLDYIMIGKIFSAATLGFYQRAKSLDYLVVYYSSSSLVSVLFPVLSRVSGDFERFKSIVTKLYVIVVFAIFLILGGVYLTSTELILILYGEKWVQSAEYFKILALSGFSLPISSVLTNVLTSRGKSKLHLRVEITKKMILLVNLIVGFSWGVHGFLYGLIVASSINVVLSIVVTSREIKVSAFNFLCVLLIQLFLTVVCVSLVEYIFIYNSFNLINSFILKGISFIVLYFLVNALLKTTAFMAVTEQLKPLLLKANV